ncbi:MAG: SurA N-terminal domain-containing protein [Candidatus Rokubacteria bacterium]|nr:SurA N-terminal domain-containing protein [Candidatus Rokubacteria bacterium]
MITFMRRYPRTIQGSLLVVIAGFVASLFIFGAQSKGADPRDWVARVNDETITPDQFQRRYAQSMAMMGQIYGQRFTPELAERLGLPQQVVEDLVNETLVVQRARAEGLEVGDEELNARIHRIPAFQENGRFSLKRYQDVLAVNQLTPSMFEADVRRQMTRERVEQVVRGGIKASDAEVEQVYVARNEEVRATWALVDAGPIAAATPASDGELEAYLKERAADFRLPERRRAQYVAINPKDVTPRITEADVERYYTANAAEFESPPQVHAAHVLVAVPQTGGSAAEDQAKATVAEVIRRAKAGEDFAALAKAVSQDPGSAAKGGDLGFIKKGEVMPDFERAVFALKKGEISPEPVRTPYGFHAIKVLEVREGGKKPLREAAAQIRQKLEGEGADRAARARADEVRPKLQAAADFMAEARQLGLVPVETTLSRQAPIPGLGRPDTLQEAAFGLAVGGISTPLRTPAGYVILKNAENLPATVPPLTEIRDRVATAVKRQKAETVALERARQLAADARRGDFAEAARQAGATTGETAPFSRSKPAERLAGDAMLAALQTPVHRVTDPVKTGQGYYVLKVLERVAPDMARFAGERDKLAQEVVAQKQGQAWTAWIDGARRTARIEIAQRYLPRAG